MSDTVSNSCELPFPVVAVGNCSDGHSLRMQSFSAGGLEILIDECAPRENDLEAEGISTWEVLDEVIGGNLSVDTSVLGDLVAATVHSPSTPHPYTMSPAPPPGEPPSLMRNKRPHGLFDELNPLEGKQQTDTCPFLSSSHSSAPAIDVGDLLPTTSCLAQKVGIRPNAESSASGPTSSSSGSSIQSSPRQEESCMVGILETSSTSNTFHASVIEISNLLDRQSETPEMPPGPPPAQMAPPPPVGPPPDLPLDRAELKRTVEDSGSSPLGKRLRSQKEEDGTGPHLECSTDGESTTSSSEAEDTLVVEHDRARNDIQSDCEDGVEASYKQSPASARWVWDRFLQHDRQLASAQMLEKRMLRALESLSMGSAQKSDDD